MSISSEEFSVVIQGPIHGKPLDPEGLQVTQRAIDSVRNNLPNSEIIISTWNDNLTDHLVRYDLLVKSEDPGAITYNDGNYKDKFHNLNRQIVSTKNALEKASRKYAIKMRTDSHLINTNFISYIGKYSSRHEKYNLFQERVLIPTVYTRNPRRIPILFHVSDLFQVGLLNDLKQLWDIPLAPEPETTRYLEGKLRPLIDPYPEDNYLMRYASEQYIWIAFCKKKDIYFPLSYYGEINLFKLTDSEISVINNFVFVDPIELGIYINKRIMEHRNLRELYSFDEWEKLYNIYSKGSTSIFYIIKFVIEVLFNNIKYCTLISSFSLVSNNIKYYTLIAPIRKVKRALKKLLNIILESLKI